MMSMFTSTGSCPTIYGPVSSRRHGLSLGVNLGAVDKKICTWRCVYCQCGMGEHRDFKTGDLLPSRKEVLKLLEKELQMQSDIQSVTFAGNCEPTTHPEFLEIVENVIEFRKKTKSTWKLVVLSNGSELDRKDVIKGLNQVDEAWIKLDCAEEDLFKRLNKPLQRVGGLKEHIDRIKKLEKICIQTLLWACPSMESLSNFSASNQEHLVRLYKDLSPLSIHVATIQREPAVKILKPVTFDELNKFKEILLAAGLNAEIYF